MDPAETCSAGAWHFFRSDRLDISPCFQDSLAVFPLIAILLCGYFEWVKLRAASPKDRYGWRGGLLLYSKLTFASTACFIALFYVIYGYVVTPTDPVGNLAAVITFVSMLPAIPLHHLAHTRARRSSSTLLLFWLLTTLVSFLKLRSFLYTTPPARVPLEFASLFLLTLTSLAVFALECLCPEPTGGIRLPDTSSDESIRECPRVTANMFSRWYFSWMTPMMKQGYQKYIQEQDLWALPEDDRIEVVSRRFSRQLQRQLSKKKPRVIIALVRSFGRPYLFAAFLKTAQDVLAFVQPQLLRRLLNFVQRYRSDDPEPLITGYILALLMFLCAVIQTATLHQYFQRCYETGMRVRAAAITAVYEKSLRLSSDEKGARATGDIVNLQSTDSVRLCDFCTYGQIAWSGVFQLTLAFISLYNLLGAYGLVGVLIMILSLPLNALLARIQSRLQFKQMGVKDKRTRLMSEILNNIKTVKLNAWEFPFTRRLLGIRNDQELPMLRKMGLFTSATNFVWTFTPFLVSFATFAIFSSVSGKPLTADIVFTALSLFQLLSFPLAVIPMVMTSVVEAWVSVNRLSDFFQAKELQKDAVVRKLHPHKPVAGDEMFRIENGDFAWSSSSSTTAPILQDINLTLKKGELISVVGQVGSGKSSLLSAVPGEMIKLNGSVTTYGTVAYVPQQAWIMGGTVKENILFGHRYDPEFYEKTLDACALREDLAILPDGDQSEVGEKGLTLSGGQKARLTLARATYARADIYLLDDPLSAVDSHVGKHLFDNVIGPNGILASKARLLSTNALAFVSQSDTLVLMHKGIISEAGSYADISKNNGGLARLLSEHTSDFDEVDDSTSRKAGDSDGSDDNTVVLEDSAEDDGDVQSVTDSHIPDFPDGKQVKRRRSTAIRRASVISIERQRKEALMNMKASTKPVEHIERGSVKREIYKRYIKANGYIGVFFYILFIVAQQAFQVGGNYWLKTWTQSNTNAGDNLHLPYYMGIYLAFGVLQATCGLLNVVVLYCLCIIRSAKIMHDGMFHSVLRAPMNFFETTPIGVVLNRFSRDIYVADEVLARSFGSFFRTIASVLGVIFVIGGSAPMFLVVAIPLAFIYRYIQRYYLATSRELKRLDSTTRSPIFASFSETLSGLSTIRAFGQMNRFITLNEAKVERNQEAYFLSVTANRWLAVRLEFIGAVVILTTAVAVVSTLSRGALDAGLAGLMMSYALSLTQSLNWTVRMATEIETNIVSVERITEYTELTPESPLEIPENKPSDDWPSRGAIEFDDFSMRYRAHLDPVLKNITFSVKPDEKIGVCGRTGAGKSSLMMALFRVVEGYEGKIVVDGVDIGKIGLSDLRSKLSIIPQDSQCFDGTIRDNLDPIGLYSDADLWRALEQSRMKDHVMSMQGALEAVVEEGGSNLSAGQRQLMCLARALLRRSKVLVLDEATSSADANTDREVQEVIRKEFVDCTVLTIAHRLNTIVDSSRVLSMKEGRIVEYDSPKSLIETEGSLFASLCRQAGIDHI